MLVKLNIFLGILVGFWSIFLVGFSVDIELVYMCYLSRFVK